MDTFTAQATAPIQDKLADDLMAVLIANPKAWELVFIKLNFKPDMMPSNKYRMAYEGVLQLRKEGKPVTDALLLAHCRSTVSEIDLELWNKSLDDLINTPAVVTETVKQLKDYAMKRDTIKRLDQSRQALLEGKPRRLEVSRLIADLSQLHAESERKEATALSIGDELDALLDLPAQLGIPTGLNWFDENFMGLGKSTYWAIVAPYKSRKTTTALNVVLGSLMLAYATDKPLPSIAYLSGEMTRDLIALNLIAMLASAWLHIKGVHNRIDQTTDVPYAQISGKNLRDWRGGYKRLAPLRVEAINFGYRIFRDVIGNSLRIYDKRADTGGIVDFPAVESTFRADKVRWKTDLAVVDYMQIFETGVPRKDSAYDKSEIGAALFEKLYKTTETTFMVLAQQNEEGVKNGTGYSPQVAGGAGLSKAVEYLVENWYKRNDMPDDQVQWNMKLSRFEGQSSATAFLHPHSGLVLSNYWMQALAKKEGIYSDVQF